MPSKSPAQARLMAAAAHNPSFAAKAGVPVKVAREFNAADQRPSVRQSLNQARAQVKAKHG